MTLKLDIQAIADSLSIGDTVREVCPSCNGGSTHERSLSVTVTDEGVLYQCFRNKCDVAGILGGTPSKRSLEKKLKKEKRRWEGETSALPKPVLAIIKERWGIDDPRNWYFTRDFGGRIAFSIRTPKNTHRGYQLRQIAKESRWPKALTYVNEGEPGLSWYRQFTTSPLVLVEDIPSAVRASKYVNAVALLGTNCTEQGAEEIRVHRTGPVYVALDNDATAQAFKLARRYGLLWGEVSVLPLTHDIKDSTEDMVQALLEELQ